MGVTLDESDPFEKSLADMVRINLKKRGDYALDSDPWSNFRETAERCGMGSPLDAVIFNIEQKLVRLKALKQNGREPQNEAVADTWLDISVYATIGKVLADEAAIALAMALEHETYVECPDDPDMMCEGRCEPKPFGPPRVLKQGGDLKPMRPHQPEPAE